MAPLRELLKTVGLKTYVSQSGLAAVFSALHESGHLADAPPTRKVIKRARVEDMRIETPYGPLFREISVGNGVNLPIAHPAAMLHHACSQCETFGRFLFQRAQSHPSTPDQPWHIAVYSDEITMGNALKPDNRRKVQACYWTITELGPHHMSSEISWFFLTLGRSHIVSTLPGGMSEFMKLAIRSFFDPTSDFLKGGLLLDTALGKVLLFCKVSILVGDERSIKDTWAIKGASGTMCCFLCRNVVLPSSELHTTDPTSTLQPSTNLDATKVIPQTRASLMDSVRTLREQAGVLGVGAFNTLCQSLGLNYVPNGILFDTDLMTYLDPVEMSMYDWMHCYVVAGVFNVELKLLLAKLRAVGVNHLVIDRYLKQFSWPRRLASRNAACKRLFEKDTEFKSSASDALSIYPVLRLFLQVHVAPRFRHDLDIIASCSSFFHLCTVLDVLRKINHGGAYNPTRLSQVILNHLDKFQIAYGLDPWIPKCHYVTHLATQMSRHGLLISCFVHERKHKEVKRFGTDVDNTVRWEHGVLQSVVKVHLLALTEDNYFPHDNLCKLVDPRPAEPHVVAAVRHELGGVGADIKIAHTAFHAAFSQSSRLDFVVADVDGCRQVVQIWFHLDVDGHVLSCVAQCDRLGGNRFKISSESVLIHTKCIIEPCIYHVEGDVVVIAPTL